MIALTSHLDPMIPTTILVVDPKQSDYDCLLRLAVAEGHEVRFLATAGAALRQRHEIRGGLMIINVELPDRSGFDLVEMLQPSLKGTTVFLVGDRYAVEDEVRALRLGVSSYLCKPLEGFVLHECRSTQRALKDYRTEENYQGGKEVNTPREPGRQSQLDGPVPFP
jgi:DNA-binding response OmpR family regulator